MKTYINVMGGLGNQLHQYAFACYLQSNGIVIDGLLSDFYQNDPHQNQYLLGQFASIPSFNGMPQGCASVESRWEESGPLALEYLRQHQADDIGIKLVGYWQNEIFLKDCGQQMIRELSSAYFDQQSSDQYECTMHVRRFEYGHHGHLPKTYYLEALEQLGWPDFVVFSDEPNFCRHEYSGVRGFQQVFKGDAQSPMKDFYAMASGRKQIIANSTFSWWTAWYGEAKGNTQQVISPTAWSLIGTKNACPSRWLLLPCILNKP